MKVNKLKKLKKLIKEEIKKLQEQPSPPWFNNTGYNLASAYINSIGGVFDDVFVLDPDNFQGPTPNNFGTNTPMTPCSNGGRDFILASCDGGNYSYVTGQIEYGNVDSYGFSVYGQTNNYVISYTYCSFINGQTPNASHIGKIITAQGGSGIKSMVLAISPFNSNPGASTGSWIICPGGTSYADQDGCDSSCYAQSFTCGAAGTPQASCVSLQNNSGPFNSLEECLDSGCAPVIWEGSCSTYDNFIEQTGGLSAFEIPEEISLEEGKDAFCDKCYGKDDIPQSWVGDPWGFCNCCPPLEITAPPVDDPIPVKEPVKGPSIDKEDPQIQKMQKLAGIKPEKKDESKQT